MTPGGLNQTQAAEAEPAVGPDLPTIVLVAVALIHLAIAFPALDPAPHNGGDNAGYLSLAHSLATGEGYVEAWDPNLAPHTKYPPLYPALLAGAMGLGAEAWVTFKLLSLLLVTVSVVVCFGWMRDRHGLLLATGVSLVLVFSPAFLWSTNWILSDPLFLALTLACLWSFHRAEHALVPSRWILAGCALAILSTLTRTAGLPLVLAVGASLVLARRWRALAGFAGVFVGSNLLWWLRSRAGGAQYVSEFWMIDPYQPDLGRAGLGDLVARLLENLQGYVLVYIPAGLSPWGGWQVAVLGLVLMAAALAGWVARIRVRWTVAELFTPLYFGLILLWPAVWSGDRFALPLYPLVLFYAAEALVLGSKRLGARIPLAAGAIAVAVLVVPSMRSWRQSVSEAAACRAVVRVATGPFGCDSEGFRQFASAARWVSENVPDGSAVFSRKPRIFYTLSGVPGRMYPLSPDPESFFREAREIGVSYVVLDRVDARTDVYVGAVVRARPWAFCGLTSVGEGDARTLILGIVEDAVDPGDVDTEALTITFPACPQRMVRLEPRPLPAYSAARLPLLALPSP